MKKGGLPQTKAQRSAEKSLSGQPKAEQDADAAPHAQEGREESVLLHKQKSIPAQAHTKNIFPSLPLTLFSGNGRKTVGRRRRARQRTPALTWGRAVPRSEPSALCGRIRLFHHVRRLAYMDGGEPSEPSPRTRLPDAGPRRGAGRRPACLSCLLNNKGRGTGLVFTGREGGYSPWRRSCSFT